MKYVYAAGNIIFGKEKWILDTTSEERAFIKKGKLKIYVNKIDISHFWWIEGHKKWTLKIYRKELVKNIRIWDRYRAIVIDGCYCSISTETI